MSGQSDPSQDKNSMAMLWIIVMVFVMGALVWYFFQDYLKMAFIFVKKWEAIALGFFIEDMKPVIDWLSSALPSNVTMETASQVSNYIGGFLMYPAIVILLIFAIIMFKSSITMRFNKIYSMDSLLNQEKKNWPQIAPVSDLDMMEFDINKGVWSMAMNPMQFGKKMGLLEIEMVPDRTAVWRSEGVPKATVNREKAMRVFAAQLGPLWMGVDKLPPYAKALYSVFLARTEHDTKAAEGYLQHLSASAAKGQLDFSLTDTFLKKHGKCKAAQRCHSRHAYMYTVMASMIELARTDGVLASADFLWLKPVDRKLWYMLNSVGRQVAVVEVAGAFAHWLAEKEMARPLNVPMIEEAVYGFELAISKMLYVPDEEEETKQLGQEVH